MTNSEESYMDRHRKAVENGSVHGVLTGQVQIHMLPEHDCWPNSDDDGKCGVCEKIVSDPVEERLPCPAVQDGQPCILPNDGSHEHEYSDTGSE